MEDKKNNLKKYYDAIILLLILGVYSFSFLSTISDYGVSSDETLGKLYLGDKYFNLYTSFNSDFFNVKLDNIEIYKDKNHPNFHSMAWFADKNAEGIWGLGPTLSSFSKYIFFKYLKLLSPIEAHHISLLICMIFLLISIYLFTLKNFSRTHAIFSSLALASYPYLLANAHFNITDIPSVLFFSLTIITFFKGIKENEAKLLLISSIFCGLSLATKETAFLLPIIIFPWFVLVIIGRIFSRKPVINFKMLFSLYFYPIIATLIMLISWPYLMDNFPNNLIKTFVYLLNSDFSGENNWSLIPIITSINKTPLFLLIMFFIGLVVSFYRFILNKKNESGVILLLFFWLCIPILRESVPTASHSKNFNYWLEFLPPLLIISSIGASSIIFLINSLIKKIFNTENNYLKVITSFIFFLASFSPIIFWNYLNHPYGLVFLNSLSSYLPETKNSDNLEPYYRESFKWLNHNAKKDSYYLIETNEHIINYTDKNLIRDDLHFKNLNYLIPLVKTISEEKEIYLISIINKGNTPEINSPSLLILNQVLKTLHQKIPPIHQIKVENKPILKITKLPLNKLNDLILEKELE